MKPRGEIREAIGRSDAAPEPAGASRGPTAPDVQNLRPLKVTDLVEKFGKSAYTIRQWANKGKLKGAKRVGRDWAFPLDVDYVEGAVVAIAPSVQVAVKEALEMLDRYPIGAARAA